AVVRPPACSSLPSVAVVGEAKSPTFVNSERSERTTANEGSVPQVSAANKQQRAKGERTAANEVSVRVAFQGEVGAYSEEAVRTLFPGAEVAPRPTFEEVFEAAESAVVDR